MQDHIPLRPNFYLAFKGCGLPLKYSCISMLKYGGVPKIPPYVYFNNAFTLLLLLVKYETACCTVAVTSISSSSSVLGI